MDDSKPNLPSHWKRSYFTIWTGQAVSLIGSSLVQFALIWWLTEETGSATVLATASLVALLPNALLAPFAGVIVDRSHRRTLLILSDASVALSTLGLAILFHMGQVQIYHVYIVIFMRSLGGIFQFPAMRASTSLMVPEAYLSKVAGYNQVLSSILRIVTPPVGAMFLNILPMQNVLMIDVFTALLGILPLFFMKVPQPGRSLNGKSSITLLGDLKNSLRYIRSLPGFLYLIGMMSILNFLLDPAFSLMPILVQDHFDGSALQFAWVRSAQSLGGLASGLLFSVWMVRRKVFTSMLGVAGVGLGCLVVGFAPSSMLVWAVLGAFMISLMMGISDAPIGALFQARIAPEMQGRVFSVMGSLMTILSLLGLSIAGPLADEAGVQIWFVTGGLLCVLMGLAAMRIQPILQLEKGTHKDIPATNH